MHLRSLFRVALCSAALSLFAASAFAQATQAKPFEPQVGQAGKDVVWVPTPQALVDKMLDMAKVTPQDFLMDLGSGDGRTVITAAKRGLPRAWASNTTRTWWSSRSATPPPQASPTRRHVHQGRPLRDRLLEGAGHHDVPAADDQHEAAADHPEHEARHAHRVEHVHDGGLAARSESKPSRSAPAGARPICGSCPAKVAGTWQTPQGALTLTQSFQMLTGHARNHADRRRQAARRRDHLHRRERTYTGRCRATRFAAR